MTATRIPSAQELISGVVLAGGQSSRFGTDKAFLQLDGQPLVARAVWALSALSQDLIVVTNEPERYEGFPLPARLVPDRRVGVGSLMGIYSGVKAARFAHALVVACDMPFLNQALLRYMLSLREGHDVVIPRLHGWLEPLHAIYSQACLPHMDRLLQHGERQIIAFFDAVRVRYVDEDEVDRFDPDHLSFLNVNTPDDWEQVLARFSTSNNCPR
jgi:molybdopterin-guanine dinucleotide biosynthesis protein A